MTTRTLPLLERPAWAALQAHHRQIAPVHLRKLFADDPERGERLTLEAAGIYLDYSKNRVTDETLSLLVQLAEESGLRERIDAMFGGEQHQRHRESGRAARGPAGAERRIRSSSMARTSCRRSTRCSTR